MRLQTNNFIFHLKSKLVQSLKCCMYNLYLSTESERNNNNKNYVCLCYSCRRELNAQQKYRWFIVA